MTSTTDVRLLVVDHQSPAGYPEAIEERVESGEQLLVASYVYGAGLDPISVLRVGQPVGLYLADGHSGVRQVVDLAGTTVLAAYRYDAFGNKVTTAGTFSDVIGYRGERLDPVLGQYYLRIRPYDTPTGRFTAMDPLTIGVTDRPSTQHKYAYTSGDPLQFADPSGLFEGLVGLLGSLNTSLTNRAKQLPANSLALQRVQTLKNFVSLLQNILHKVQKIKDAVDLFDDVTNILELTTQNKAELRQKLSILSAIPSTRQSFTFELPPKITKKLKQFVRLAKNYMGKDNSVQAVLAEWGAAMAANAVDLKLSKLDKPHDANGIDQLRRHKQANFWAIIEAKTNKGELRKTRVGREMSAQWIRAKLKDTLRVNQQHPERELLENAIDLNYGMLAVVFRVRTDRKNWQLKVTAQKFAWRTHTLNWSGA
jgi:RHS repeat-associated protein